MTAVSAEGQATPAGANASRVGQVSCWTGLIVVLMLVAGCGQHRQSMPLPPQATAPTAGVPSYPTQPTYPPATTPPSISSGSIPITPLPEGGISTEDKEFILSHRPIFSQAGEATWYTAPYKGRKSANGQVFSDELLTAAHRTLPMGSLIVVTNLATRQASAMRVSDRGPFVPGKIIDLTRASAKSIGIYPGSGRVRVDVYQTPKPIDTGGRWCVQIGAFTSERAAERMKEDLMRRYPEARVIEFTGERNYWVRIRPERDDRVQAEFIAGHVHPSEGDAYLTRLD